MSRDAMTCVHKNVLFSNMNSLKECVFVKCTIFIERYQYVSVSVGLLLFRFGRIWNRAQGDPQGCPNGQWFAFNIFSSAA